MHSTPGSPPFLFANSSGFRLRPHSVIFETRRHPRSSISPHPNPPDTASAALRPTAFWVEHFRANQGRNWNIPWDKFTRLPEEERLGITPSIAEFQRCASSEASHYLRLSARFAQQRREPEFHEASVLFVREKNAHASLLLRFMNGAAIPAGGQVFSDAVFRRVRAFGDLAWSSRVLLVAELVAQEYHPCLRAATTHPVLTRLCDKLIHDQFAHVRFHVERIARLEAGLLPAQRLLREHLQGALLVGAAIAVYRAHRTVLASLGAPAFLHRLLRRFRRATRAIRVLVRELARPGNRSASPAASPS